MRKTFIALLSVVLLLAMAVPAFAAGRMSGTAAQAGDRDMAQLHQQDQLQDRLQGGTGENCTTDGVPLQDGIGAPAQAQAQRPAEMPAPAAGHMRSGETTGKPEWAGETTPTANAQSMLTRNAERVQVRLDMPAEIKTKLATLFEDIVARLQAAFGQQ